MAVMLDQTRILFDPEIIWNRITALSYAFYAAYAALAFMPFTLEVLGRWKFSRSMSVI
jgi:hypothetical protein